MIKPLLSLFLFFTVLCSTHAQEGSAEIAVQGQEKADALLKELQKYYGEGDYDLHKAYSDSLSVVAEKYGLTQMHVLALTNQAVFHNNRSERQKAITLYHEALEKCKLIPEDARTRTVVLVNLGNTYFRIEAYDKAIATMEEVLVVAEEYENSDRVKAAALIGLSNNYTELKDYERALKYAYEAKAIGEKNEKWPTVAIALNNISDSYIQLKDYTKALETSTAALELPFLKKPTKSRGWMLLNTGISNYYLKNYDVALKNLEECIALTKEKNLAEIEMYCHEYVAKIYEEKNDFEASYTAQKKYTLLRNELQNDKNDATSTDLKNEISAREETIAANSQALDILSQNKQTMLIWGLCLLLLLGGLLFFYIKRKKQIEAEQEILRAQFLTLQERVAVSDKETTTAFMAQEGEEKPNKTPYKNSSLTNTDRQKLKKQILAFMEGDKPYLDANLTQADLADKIGISSHHFSEALHYGFQQNFYNFVNSYRVQEAQALMNNTEYQDAKIIAIAFDAGFKSKTSFNRVFKKHTGTTPSEYRASLNS